MTGVHAATARLIHFAMDSASGSSRGVAQSHSMSQSQAITNCATARCLRMPLSVTEHTSTSGSGGTKTIADSGPFGVLLPSGAQSATGCSISTGEKGRSFSLYGLWTRIFKPLFTQFIV